MEIVKGYFDYCVSERCFKEDNSEKCLKRLYELGYRTIAVNQTISESSLEPKKKKKKGEVREIVDFLPPPIEIEKGWKDLKVLNRLTVIFSNQEVINKIIKSPNYKKYHIIAVQPESQQAFQFTCSSIEADILTYNPENKIDYKINRKLYNQLVDRGFHFELLYAPAIQDSTQRKNLIALAHLYHAFGKSKNIIISSGATNNFLIRNCYDIINLGLILGLSEEQSKNSVLHCGRSVFIHSIGRRIGKAFMFMETITDTERKDHNNKEDNEDEEMILDQPAYKKSKQ